VSAGPRRRGEAVVTDVLDATLTLLAERGYEFSVDEVAASAGVHKTSVYRRWPTKPALVAAAIQRIADEEVETSPTTDPLADLERVAVQVARALRRPAGANALRAALTTAGADAELRSTAAGFLASRYRQATHLVEAAQAQGLLRDDVDPTLLWQAVVNPLHMNAVLGGPLDDDTARSLLALVLNGALVDRARR
jgi:AcrR family transcriptional regulator